MGNVLPSPTAARLGQLIVDASEGEENYRLEFFLEIDFPEAEIDDEDVRPFFRASNIDLGVKSWRAIADSAHEFPWAPKPGSIDAAVLLFGEQNPADVTALKFGSIEDGKITVSFSTEIDFEIEADRDELGQVAEAFESLVLEIGPAKVSTAIAKRCEDDPEQITAALADAIDLSCYSAVEKVPGGFAFGILA